MASARLALRRRQRTEAIVRSGDSVSGFDVIRAVNECFQFFGLCRCVHKAGSRTVLSQRPSNPFGLQDTTLTCDFAANDAVSPVRTVFGDRNGWLPLLRDRGTSGRFPSSPSAFRRSVVTPGRPYMIDSPMVLLPSDSQPSLFQGIFFCSLRLWSKSASELTRRNYHLPLAYQGRQVQSHLPHLRCRRLKVASFISDPNQRLARADDSWRCFVQLGHRFHALLRFI